MVRAALPIPDARLVGAVAQAFSYPRDGVEATLGALREWLRDASPEAEGREQAEDVLDAAGCFPDRTAEQLAYTRLFIGSLEMMAPPYASYYMSEDRTLNGKVASEVAAVYDQFGIRLSEDEVAPPDHLRYLLTFLSLLAARYEETGEEAFADAYADFRDAYVAPWFGQFRLLVEKAADAPYYPALVNLVGTVLF